MLLKDKISLWRNRFFGRQESFGSKVSYFNKKKNKMVTHYVAEFADAYKDSEARKGVTIENTSAAEYFIPLQDNHVEGHLKGFKELLIYVLQTNGTTKFAALDFDTKHTFEDVLKCYDMISIAHQIPCYIARSTTKGHHLYLFFDDFIEAKYVTSYVAHVYEELGFLENHRNGVKPIPETFPKTIAVPDALSTGYGIKPPMQGEGMGRDMNCWVDAENGMDVPIGNSGNSDEQWDYFASTEKIKVQDFKDFLDKSRIAVEEIRVSEKRGVVPQDRRRTIEYKPPNDGDIHRVIQGCPAMKAYWEGSEADFKHHARVALVSWAMQTKNGLEVLQERWKGSDQTESQIQYAIDNVQQPWTCKAVQDHNCCILGRDPKFCSGQSKNGTGMDLTDHCFRKASPKETINGKLVSNPRNLAESEWADPSPVRLRIELKRVTVNGLKEEIDELSKDDPELGIKVAEVYSKMLHLKDKKKRAEVETHLKSKKLAKVKELKEIAKEAKAQRQIESEREVEDSGRSRPANGYNYALGEDGGYALLDYDAEGGVTEKPICNFQIDLQHDVHVHSLIKDDTQTFSGQLVMGEKKKRFQISADDYATNVKFAQAITRCGRLEALVPTYNLDHLRAAVHLFGRKNMKVEHRYEDYGFENYREPVTFRASKWNITADGFTGEDDSYVDLSGGGHAQYLDIEKIGNAQFAELINIIRNDYFNFQEHKLTYTTLAHTLQATIQLAFFPLAEAPVLWIQGLTGAGKTTLSKFAQSFHGDFPRLLNVTGTTKAIEYMSMLFKDSLLVLDDYKEGYNRGTILKLIQSIYERSARLRLKTNLDQAQAPYCRGLMMMTAEDAPSSEASALARCLYLEAPQISSARDDSDKDSFYRIQDNMKHFSGITGRFIHYVVNMYSKNETLKDDFRGIYDSFAGPVLSLQNGIRAAQNVSANFLTWKLFCDFMRHNMLITREEHSDYLEEHRKNLCEIRDNLVQACFREQASNVFLDALRESILSGRLRIDGMQNNANDRADTVGYITDPTEFTVYLLPGVAMGEVKRVMKLRGAPISHSKDAIGKQLLQDGYINKVGNETIPLRKYYQGSRSYVWSVDSRKFGIGPQDGSTEKAQQEDPDEVDMATF